MADRSVRPTIVGMGTARLILTMVAVLVAAGCAAKPKPAPATQPASTRQFATRPIEPKALLTLDKLELKLDPPKTHATTAPATTAAAPLDAIELFAAARDAFLLGRRQAAVELLEKAAALEPQPLELARAG